MKSIRDYINILENINQDITEGTFNPYQQILMALRQDAGQFIDTKGRMGGQQFVSYILQRLQQLERTGDPRAKIVSDTVKLMIGDAQRAGASTKGLSFGTLAQGLMDLTRQELQKVNQQSVAGNNFNQTQS